MLSESYNHTGLPDNLRRVNAFMSIRYIHIVWRVTQDHCPKLKG